jgi:hypothetical protein
MRGAIRTLLIAVAAAAACAPPASAIDAPEVGRPSAVCSWEVLDKVSPGWTINSSRGVAHADGFMDCVGAVDGRALAGQPGSFAWDYTYDASDVLAGGNTCLHAGAHGKWAVDRPMADGATLSLRGPWSWIAAGTLVEAHGRFGAHPVEMLMPVTYLPADHLLDQNCIDKPFSTNYIIGPATIGSAAATSEGAS